MQVKPNKSAARPFEVLQEIPHKVAMFESDLPRPLIGLLWSIIQLVAGL